MEDAVDDGDGEEDLEGDGSAPAGGVVDERETKVEPECNVSQRNMTVWTKRTDQYAMTVPMAIIDASIQMWRPRLCDFEHSACHDGIVAVFTPVPNPVTIRPMTN